MVEPMRSGKPKMKFGYADDIEILGIGPTTAEPIAAAQVKVDDLIGWARSNAIAFDTEKSEVVQFLRHYRDAAAGISINGQHIEQAPHIRWLGVYFYPKLNFRYHVAKWR